MDSEITKIKIVECICSLNTAIQEAGGRVLTAERIKNMSLMEFITTMAGQNNIRFVYEKPDYNEEQKKILS